MGTKDRRYIYHDRRGRSPRISICLTVALLFATAGPVLAQEALEEVVVTGTRIERSGMTTATPLPAFCRNAGYRSQPPGPNLLAKANAAARFASPSVRHPAGPAGY